MLATEIARDCLRIIHNDPRMFESRFPHHFPACLNTSLWSRHQEIVNIDDEVCLVLGVPVAGLPLRHFCEATAEQLFFTMSFPIASAIRVPV